MSEYDAVEQSLRSLVTEKAPETLRVSVLGAIEKERTADSSVMLAGANHDRWFHRFERAATFGAPCLLVVSLLAFSVVHWSTDNMLGGNRATRTGFAENTAKSGERLAISMQPTSITSAFQQHLVILQNLSKELFDETFEKTPKVDRYRRPLGGVDRGVGRRVSELASFTAGGSSLGSPARRGQAAEHPGDANCLCA